VYLCVPVVWKSVRGIGDAKKKNPWHLRAQNQELFFLVRFPIQILGETLGCARHLLAPTVSEASRGGGLAITPYGQSD
jgi:hypothetical protein